MPNIQLLFVVNSDANANIKSSQTQVIATFLAALVGVVRVGAVGVEVDDLLVLGALLAQVAAALLVRRTRDRLRLQSELVDPELNLVANVRVVRCAAEDRTHVQRVGGHRLLVFNGGAMLTYPSLTRWSLIP